METVVRVQRVIRESLVPALALVVTGAAGHNAPPGHSIPDKGVTQDSLDEVLAEMNCWTIEDEYRGSQRGDKERRRVLP